MARLMLQVQTLRAQHLAQTPLNSTFSAPMIDEPAGLWTNQWQGRSDVFLPKDFTALPDASRGIFQRPQKSPSSEGLLVER
jgi:hypothetical protein